MSESVSLNSTKLPLSGAHLTRTRPTLFPRGLRGLGAVSSGSFPRRPSRAPALAPVSRRSRRRRRRRRSWWSLRSERTARLRRSEGLRAGRAAVLGQDLSVKPARELQTQHLDDCLHLLHSTGGQVGLTLVDQTEDGLQNLPDRRVSSVLYLEESRT